MGRVPAVAPSARSTPPAAPSPTVPSPAFPREDAADVLGFQQTLPPSVVRPAPPARRSIIRPARGIGSGALLALGALLLGATLLDSQPVAATVVLLFAVIVGAWRGVWSGVTSALLTTAGLGVLLLWTDAPASTAALDMALFLGMAGLVLARCGWQERRATRLLTAAQHDPLTGLLNRAALLEGLDRACSTAVVGGPSVALICLDIDDFKEVNDELGHAAGDELLCAVAGRLATRLRPGDRAARPGGDEFTLLLAPGTTLGDAAAVAKRLLAALDEPFLIRDRSLHVTASAGVAVAYGREAVPQNLLEQADVALYQAKRGGKARAVAYTAPLPADV